MKKSSTKKERKYGKILNIDIVSTSKNKVLRDIRQKIDKKAKFSIFTPNPEIVLASKQDQKLKEALNSSEMLIPDGIGIAIAYKFMSLPNPKNPIRRIFTLIAQGMGVGVSALFDKKWIYQDFEVIKGRELFKDLIEIANRKKWNVFLLGDREKSAKKAKDNLLTNYKSVKIFEEDGPNLDNDANPSSKTDAKIEEKAIKRINEASPELLFVAFGAPKQEKWVMKHKDELDACGIMVVGGAFDYISGKAKLPPKWIEEVGFEWLWRLFKQPERFKRVFNAVILFSFEVFLDKLNRNSNE